MVFAMTSAFSRQNSVSLCPASLCSPRPNLPVTQVSLEEKGMVTYSSILAWKIPWTEEPGVLQSMGLERVGHDQETNTHTHTHPLTSGLRNLKNIYGSQDALNV